MVQKDCVDMSKMICIAGPTAVGKSALALALAQKLGSCIVSADSMQIYKGMDKGTAKPSKAEQAAVKHYMIDIVEPNCEFNAFMFAQQAEPIIEGNPNAVVVGGTGLYFESLIYGLDFSADDDTVRLRNELWQYCEQNGREALYELLKEKDAEKAEKIHANNVKSVIRALEILSKGGETKPKAREPKREYVLFALNDDRDTLYDRINKRVDKMIDSGLVDEVRRLSELYDTRAQAFQAIGYKEIVEFLNGKTSLEQAVELIKQHTRNYAKRQITFIKRLNPIWLDAKQPTEKLLERVLTEIEIK